MTAARFVCYVHRRRDTGEPFYVGVGRPGRERTFGGRSAEWRAIAAAAGVEVEVVARGLSLEAASAWEAAAVELLGRSDLGKGPLANRADGGGGSRGYVSEGRGRKLDKSIAFDYIRARCEAGARQADIAAALGVSRQRIATIVRDLGLKGLPRGRPKKMPPVEQEILDAVR